MTTETIPDQSLWKWAKMVVGWAKEGRDYTDESWRHAALKMSSKVLEEPHVEGLCVYEDRVKLLEERALATLKDLTLNQDPDVASYALATLQDCCPHDVVPQPENVCTYCGKGFS